MAKWLCRICKAINPTGANCCHNCGNYFGSLCAPIAGKGG